MTTTHYVYRLFDADDRLLYVGCTGQPHVRLATHRRKVAWGHKIDPSRTTLDRCISEEVALDHERALIQTFKPPHNRKDNPRYWPRLEDPKKLTLCLERKLHNRLRRLAVLEREVPVHRLVSEALEQFLDRAEAELKASA